MAENACDHPEYAKIVRSQCPASCDTGCVDLQNTSSSAVKSAATSDDGSISTMNIIFIVIIALLFLLLLILLVRYKRLCREGRSNLVKESDEIMMQPIANQRRGSVIYTLDDDDDVGSILANDIVYSNTNTLQETKIIMNTTPIDFAALENAKDSYAIRAKLNGLKELFDQFVGTIFEDEGFDLENDDAVEIVVQQHFNDEQLSLNVEYADLLEHFDVNDSNISNTLDTMPTPLERAVRHGTSTTSLDTKMVLRDFLARIVFELRRDNLYNPKRKRFWVDFTARLTALLNNLKNSKDRIKQWEKSRTLRYSLLFNKFFAVEYQESSPSIDALAEHVSPIIEEVLSTLEQQRDRVTAMQVHERWKMSIFWTHVRLHLDKEGDGRVLL